jgi:NitT/TauT family transport system substrate-binding protein
MLAIGRRAAICAATALVGLCGLPLPARAELDRTSLALPAVSFIFSTTYLAEDAGIFKAEGLDVKTQVINGIGAANAVIAGSVDFSFSSGPTLTRAAAREQPVIGIANVIDHAFFTLLINKKIAEKRHFDPNAPLAERAKVMKGLRFGVGGIQAIPHAYLKLIAKIGGLDGEKDLVVAGITPPEQIGAMQRDAVDGISSTPPVIETLLHAGNAVVVAQSVTANADPPSLAHTAANVLMVRTDFCTSHRGICVKMGRAIVKAAAYIHDHPQEAMAMLGKRLNVKDPAVLNDAFAHLLAATPSPPVLDAQELEAADELNVEAGFMKAEEKLPSYTKVFTNEFVK